jgi:hypothetical protein
VSYFTPAMFLAKAAPLWASAKRKETTPRKGDPSLWETGDNGSNSPPSSGESDEPPRISRLLLFYGGTSPRGDVLNSPEPFAMRCCIVPRPAGSVRWRRLTPVDEMLEPPLSLSSDR